MVYVYRDNVNANLICCICRNPFIDPTSSTTCGHTFCLECITEALAHTPQCPVDRSSLRHDDLRPAHAIIRNLVDELLVECPNNPQGCPETPQRHTVLVHARDVCGYTAIPCPSAKCKAKPLRKDLAAHQAVCDRRSIECPACSQTIPLSEAEAHADECPLGLTTCLDCEADVSRASLTTHSSQCPLKTVSCTHASLGCPWVGIRDHLTSIHIPSCPYEALKGFFAIREKEMGELRMENTVMREEICSLRTTLQDLSNDLTKAKSALGPWFHPTSNQQQTQRHSLATLSAAQIPERAHGRRRLSSPFTSGVLGFIDTPTDSNGREPLHSTVPVPVSPPLGFSFTSPPLGSVEIGMGGPLLLQDFTHSQSQSPIPPINTSTTIEGSLQVLRNSVVTLSTELESLSRRQNMHFTTEMLRMHEEVASLRATVHGLRMQVHTFMTSNALSGGIGYTQYGSGDSATVQYVNQSPPPSTVISIANTVTHRRVAENKL